MYVFKFSSTFLDSAYGDNVAMGRCQHFHALYVGLVIAQRAYLITYIGGVSPNWCDLKGIAKFSKLTTQPITYLHECVYQQIIRTIPVSDMFYDGYKMLPARHA